ncbi:diaminopimelate decarboxylase [Aerococcaceae bacterium DSM 111020]|nr:diaminopimelate decarboxylase [Aerococcaceae bacterium DSM 111020]
MKLESYQQIKDDRLTHRGYDYERIAQEYQTPLYIFDEPSFIERVKGYRDQFQSEVFETEILYASKALLTKEIARLVARLDIGQDVVSAGEIYAGQAGGIDAKRMYFHGNNKTDQELLYAIKNGVGTIVLDNQSEAHRLNHLIQQSNEGHIQKVLLRVNPGIEASTHEYILTATNDSKFGENIHDSEIFMVISEIAALSHLNLVGFHSHIGSQIFEADSFLKASESLIDFAQKVMEQTALKITELNFGGGFGVYYTEEDQPFDVIDYLPRFVKQIEKAIQEAKLPIEKVAIEPGRSLVNASGSTLYRVGDLKQTLSGKHYLFVDGGMTDNIRPALYQAKYEAALVNKITDSAKASYTIAGKACESGDKIIESIMLPEATPGDLLLVNGTGAYNFTMASNYNYIPRPAMIHVTEETIKLTVKRDTLDDLVRNQL